MTRVALVGRIPGGPRPRGTVDGPISAAGARYARVRWDDGLTSGVPVQHLVVLPEPRCTIWRDEWARPAWQVDCERDGQFVGTEQFATEAEALAYAGRWY